MNSRIIFKYIGKVLIGFSILFIFPIITSLIYNENYICFLLPQIVSLIIGLILNNIKLNSENIYSKDGLKIVALSWIIISIIGALPFYINNDASLIDSLFETVSGFTTTGATIFKDVESLSKGILFWRSFTHFIGGMGILAFVMAIIPLSKSDKSMHILKAEMPGPSVGKLAPSIKKTLIYLYGIYISLTITQIILLIIGKMSIFDSILISMGTAGTGGFAVLNSSIATYSSFCQWTITIFMFLFGINFNIYFLILMKDIKSALKSEELKTYFLIFTISIAIVFFNTINVFNNVSIAFKEAAFHVSSIMTSTGYSIGDINIYPTASRTLMLVLMLISACAGSTCGGFKISRLILAFKTVKRDLMKLIHPNSIQTITFEGKRVSEDTIKSSNTFLFLYIGLLCIMIFIVSFNGFDLETTINSVFTTFANVGLCFNISNFAGFSVLSKLIFIIGMLLGRLEIFPIITLFTSIRKKD